MATAVSYSNVHQLSASDKMSVDKKKSSSPPMKMLLHQQQASPDSTNNNSVHQPPVSTVASSPSSYSSSNVHHTTIARGRGRKTSPTYVQVIPGQPVAVARRNARERNRVKQVNNGFSNLRQHIPFTARNKKMSKVETLRCAVEYIRSLQRLLDENGGYDGDLNIDLSQNVSSSSPMSSLDSGEEHSLMSMGASDVMYDTQTDTVPSSSTILVEDYNAQAAAAADFSSQLRAGVILTGPSSRLYSGDVIFDDSPLPSHPNTLIRHGSSLSPGYSDRSSVNNSPATTSAEVTTTHGFMGVFAAAAAGLDKQGVLAAQHVFKKERHDDEATVVQRNNNNNLLELEGASTSEMMEALTWWELEQARRMQHTSS